MGRKACCDKIGLKKGPWSADEDEKLRDFVHTNGTKYCWRAVPKRAGLLRCGKSCRLRWANYLRPDLKNDRLSEKEEELVIDLHSQFGNKWSKIASHLSGRTDNYIKNYWHNHIKKKLSEMGIDSVNHKPLFPDPSTVNHDNKTRKRAKRSREGMHYKDKGQNIDETSLLAEDSIIPKDDVHAVAIQNLAIDTGFSIDEIPLVEPHEFLIPQTDHLPTNCCSSSSFATPRVSTPISPSTINLIVQKLKSLNWNNLDYSYQDGFADWHWLINDFDIDKIDHEMIHPPPDYDDASHQYYSRNHGRL